ncbi:MAG: hypothetical protein LBI42_10330 [Chitinispirillales bacterium]|jgi:hypothetical protein|nr:hypothetical protein [Chitinispirillales bacterium]
MIKRICVSVWFCAFLTAAAQPLKAQDLDGLKDAGSAVDLKSFKAGLSAGFNYDLLRSLTGVSFDYPMGYFGFNIPVGTSLNIRSIGGEAVDTIFNDNELFRNGDAFKPTVGARQNANYTVMVDMPMLGGAGSFAYTQNFFLNYETTLGNTAVDVRPPFDDIDVDGIEMSLLMKGGVSIPLHLNLGWETMTFGYSYKLDRDIVFALYLHRHLFSLNFRGRADIDLLGYFDAKINMEGDGGMNLNTSLRQDINFPAEMANGSANGRYTASAWTPSVGIKLGPVSIASRFGLNTKAKGSLYGSFKVPNLVDLETGELTITDAIDRVEKNPGDMNAIQDLINLFSDANVDSITYESTEPLRWKLPQGHTITAEIIPRALSVSYTKIFGDIEMRLNNIHRTSVHENGLSWDDSLNIDYGVTVDHIMMINLNIYGAFLNLGMFALDVRSDDNENILGGAYKDAGLPRLGKAAILPVLSLGATMGSKIKLHVEGDILPLPALRTGIFYYF